MTEPTTNQVRVIIETPAGVIDVELYPNAAPITVSNFLHHVDLGLYEGGTFHRTVTMANQPQSDVKIEVIQGGVNPGRKDEVGGKIPLERTTTTGLKHIDGAISMGRLEPDSADSEVFICIGDQPELDFGGRRNPDGQGFAAFGQVTGGMNVVRTIQTSPHEEQRLTPSIQIQRIRRVN